MKDLHDAGFKINWDKSDFEPKQKGRWLGINIDTKNMVFTVPADKLEKLKTNIRNVACNTSAMPKQLAGIAGQLSAMHLALGPVVRLFTRHLYRNIDQCDSWYQRVEVTSESREEMQFWLSHIHELNGCTFKPRPTTSRIIFTDASDHGYGGFAMLRLGKLICCGRFNKHESQQSSTCRELLAVKYMLESYGNLLRNESIQVHIDTFSATRILSVGSTKNHLQKIAIDIFHHCAVKKYKISATMGPQRPEH